MRKAPSMTANSRMKMKTRRKARDAAERNITGRLGPCLIAGDPMRPGSRHRTESVIENRHNRIRLIARQHHGRREANGVAAGAKNEDATLEHLENDTVALFNGPFLRLAI